MPGAAPSPRGSPPRNTRTSPASATPRPWRRSARMSTSSRPAATSALPKLMMEATSPSPTKSPDSLRSSTPASMSLRVSNKKSAVNWSVSMSNATAEENGIAESSLVSNGWDMSPLGALLADDGLSYGIVQPGQEDPSGVPVLRVNNLRHGAVSPIDPLRVDPEIECKYQR